MSTTAVEFTHQPRPIRWSGTKAFLIECADLNDVVSIHTHLTNNPLPGQRELLAAARTVMVAFDSRPRAVAAAQLLATMQYDDAATVAGKTILIPVVYDGEDLRAVADLTNLSVEGVIQAHTSAEWKGAFGGFAPGFTYLVADNDPLNVPRRETPRTAVPAGSVALAGNFSAVYPRRSPGGWQLIGRTNERMWDLGRENPALVRPGDIVKYEATRETISAVVPDSEPESASEATPEVTADQAVGSTSTYLEIIDPGLQTLLQDLGRPGFGDLGVSASGAADKASARQANRVVGNDSDLAVLENVLGELELKAFGNVIVAITGAEVKAFVTQNPALVEIPEPSEDLEEGEEEELPEPEVRRAPLRTAFSLYDGETLRIEAPEAGLRTYVAVRGGFMVPEVLGSRATDSMSGVGPEPLAKGKVLPVGQAKRNNSVGSDEPATGVLPMIGKVTTLRITLGPRDDWFDEAGISALTEQEWTATSQSNRIGVRFELPAGGRPMTRAKDGELASEGAVPGSLQIPPSGLPVLFLADHPVTGGYPVAGVVIERDMPLAAQLPPGAKVRFTAVDPDTFLPLENSTSTSSSTRPQGSEKNEGPSA